MPAFSLKNELRCYRLVIYALMTFSLDLKGLFLLTEAATGYYALTPLIGALAGAEKVYCITRDSRYGSAREAAEATKGLAKAWGVVDRIEAVADRDDPAIRLADIVTNLGFVRPLDANFLGRLKATAVIPLMREPWEFRDSDLDLQECRRRGIPVLGTNERHPTLQTFGYIGHLCMKLLFELDIEVFQSRVVLVGSGEFVHAAVVALTRAGADVTVINPSLKDAFQLEAEREALRWADVLVVIELSMREKIIGQGGRITASGLACLNRRIVVAHIAGYVERGELEAAGIDCRPERFAPPGFMSAATDYLGPKPLIDLHAAGLKVGELMARQRLLGRSATETERRVLSETDLALGFDGGPWTVESA